MREQPVEWIVDRFIAKGTVTMLSGVSGSGKSYVALDVSDCIAQGEMFAGMSTIQTEVNYFDRENPLHVVQSRMRQMSIRDGERFRYWGGWLKPQAPSADSEVVMNYVRAADSKPVLVFDTISAFFEEGSENDAAAVRSHMNGYRNLADLGATVIVLLHASEKGGNGGFYRGSTDYKASVDCAYLVKKIGKGQLLEGVELKNFKSRYLTHEKLRLQFDGSTFSADKLAAVADKMRSLLIANAGILKSQFETLAVKEGIDRGSVREFIDSRIQRGEIEVTKGERNAHSLLWTGEMPKRRRSLLANL
jgi:hypothetical protein